MRGPSAIASSRGGLIRAGVAQDPKTPLLVAHVDVTARVDEDVLRLGHEVAVLRHHRPAPPFLLLGSLLGGAAQEFG
jgi:hypothetical protein